MPRSPSTPDPRSQGAPEIARLVGTKLGNYRLERLVGRGRMGVVYLAQDEALLRPTAIKVLAWPAAEAQGHDPVQWFLAEARLVARINDPRVVQIYGAARQGDLCYIAMEYVPGKSSDAMLAEDGRVAPEVATDILVQAAIALHAAHAAGVIHRDVKPGNLLVGPGGVTKLGDFGMAYGSAGQRVGNATVRAGTPFYTAPEIWSGAVASEASDIYALGATYFHLLTGQPPFVGPDIPAVEQGHLTLPVPDAGALVPSLPPACLALLRRALAKAPGDRQPSARALALEGRKVLQELAARGGPEEGFDTTPLPAATPMPGRLAAVQRAPPPLLEVFGFIRVPFDAIDPAQPPYPGAPFDGLRRQLRGALVDPGVSVVALTGPPGSGRTTLARQAMLDLSAGRVVLTLEEAPRRVEQLLARLEETRGRQPALLVIDPAGPERLADPEFDALVAAARWSRAFKLLLTGAPGLASHLPGAGPREPGALELAIPPLDRRQVDAYLRAWLAAARSPGARPVHLSTDALLLLERRSGGAIGALNVLAWNMLALAAPQRAAVLTSWHAWSAAADARWNEARPPGEVVPASPWPTPEALLAIDEGRRAAGLPPWPRGRVA
jgi:type II secretory pathway predicted ATPase ExeA